MTGPKPPRLCQRLRWPRLPDSHRARPRHAHLPAERFWKAASSTSPCRWKFRRSVLTTASLMEREDPYPLTVELACGKICRAARPDGAACADRRDGDAGGTGLLPASPMMFARLPPQAEPRTAERLAEKSISKACEAAEVLVRAYTRQRAPCPPAKVASEFRRFLGCGLGPDAPRPEWNPAFAETFVAALVLVEWHAIEPGGKGPYLWDEGRSGRMVP